MKIKGRIISLAMSFVVMLSVFIVAPGMNPAVYAEEEPIAVHITTPEELGEIGGEESEGKYYVLDNDIILTEEWLPIDDFRGTLDGQGYSIQNLFVPKDSGMDTAGLFGEIFTLDTVSYKVTIKNLGIEIGSEGIYGLGPVGGLIGMCGYVDVDIINCSVTGSEGEIFSGDAAGGLIGVYASEGNTLTVTGSFTKVTVSSEGDIAGGLLGSGNGDKLSVVIRDSYSVGDVSSAGYAGGLTGEISSGFGGVGTEIMISESYAVGNISAHRASGGLAGIIDVYEGTDVIVSGSYASGDIYTGDEEQNFYASGGLIGSLNALIADFTVVNSYAEGKVDLYNSGGDYGYAGGLIGYIETEESDSEIKSCYAWGDVSVSAGAGGGLIGYAIEVSIFDCYAAGSVTISEEGAAGGFAGLLDGTILRCYGAGDVSTGPDPEGFAGGLISGGNSSHGMEGTILNSYRLSLQIVDTKGTLNEEGTPLSGSGMKKKSSFDGWDFESVWTYTTGVNNGYPVLQMLADSLPGGVITGPAKVILTADYATETLLLRREDGGILNFNLYSSVLEIGGKIKSIQPVYGDTFDISGVIPKKSGKDVTVTIVNASATPDPLKREMDMYAPQDIVSNSITLLARGEKITKSEITVDYIDEIITGSGTYDFRTRLGTWQTVTLSGFSGISISNFRLGGVLDIRRSATEDAAAGPVSKIKINARQRTPVLSKISAESGVFKGISDKMEYSTDNRVWYDAYKDMPADGFTTGNIYFRMKAKDKSMKSSPVTYVYVQPAPKPVPAPEPIPEPTSEPIPEPTSEPIPEPTSEPIPEPIPEPVSEPIPEPVSDGNE